MDTDGTNWRTIFAIGFTVALIGVAVLATLPFSGSLLAGAAVASTTVATAAKITIAAGLTVASGSLIAAATEIRNNNSNRDRTSANQMQDQVERGQAPKQVDRVDAGNPNIPNNKDHIHFTDGTALNYDGTPSHHNAGIPKITNSIKKWLLRNNWKLPK